MQDQRRNDSLTRKPAQCTQIEQSSSSRLAGVLPTAPIFLNKKLVNLDAVIYFFQRSDRDLVSLKG